MPSLDPRDSLKNDAFKVQRENKQLQEQIRQMTQQQIFDNLRRKNNKDTKKRIAMLKAMLSGLINKLKNACTENVDAAQAANISNAGNGMSHGDSAKSR